MNKSTKVVTIMELLKRPHAEQLHIFFIVQLSDVNFFTDFTYRRLIHLNWKVHQKVESFKCVDQS